ncbi:Peroxisomal NADH pyrophosphatase nudt12 [Kappamyces sp. JEL0680]|nr:Peroxisomal NADH pyrophosphatase nudt12 [Kappamyces sp. JEL0680]
MEKSGAKICWVEEKDWDWESIQDCPAVYLGKDSIHQTSYWCLDVDGKLELAETLARRGVWADPRPSSFELSEFESAVFSQAKAVLDWNTRHKYCPACASITKSEDSGYKKTCENSACISRTSTQNYSHVRTDCVVIVNVVSSDGTKILLGRQKTWPPLRYSCIAGFLEPGESLEECVAREVLEETGVTIREVAYHSSQPWPYPSQLMLGAFAKATTDQIDIHSRDEELEDAQWFEKQEVLKALAQKSTVLRLPPRYAIAHTLIRAWAETPDAKM